MTSYANAIEEEIAKLNEKMSKLQTQKVEEETEKEEAKKVEAKELQKRKEKREEEMSKEAIDYEGMMIIQKVYPKFFTITATWNKTAIRNPEYEKYFNKTKKLLHEYTQKDEFSNIDFESVYHSTRSISSNLANTILEENTRLRLKKYYMCPCCHRQVMSVSGLIQHMEQTFEPEKFKKLSHNDQIQQIQHMERCLCKGRYDVNISTQQVTEKSVLESTEYYRVLTKLKKICIEPPPLYLGRLEGSSSPKYIYDDVIVDKTIDMDTNISVFIDNNPEYSVIPIHGHKYMIQKQ